MAAAFAEEDDGDDDMDDVPLMPDEPEVGPQSQRIEARAESQWAGSKAKAVSCCLRVQWPLFCVT